MDNDRKIEKPMTIRGPEVENQASRLSGGAALLERAARLEREAAGLRRLAAVLPGEMPNEADDALWNLAIRRY